MTFTKTLRTGLDWMLALFLTLAVGAIAGQEAFAQSYGSGDFGTGGIRRTNEVSQGVIADVVAARLHVEAPAAARIVAAGVGAGACGHATRNSDWYLRAAAMAACGAMGERAATAIAGGARPAVELVVRMDDGRLLSVAQEGNPSVFRRGDRVYVIRGAEGSRVVRAAL